MAECASLVEKMCGRIKLRSSRNICYAAGRVQLINSVLLSIHQYWAQAFILSKTMLDDIEKNYRAFL